MNLIHRRSPCQLFRPISQNFVVGGAAVETLSIAVDHRNHIRGIFRDQLKDLFALRQLPADPLQLQMLVYRVDIK